MAFSVGGSLNPIVQVDICTEFKELFQFWWCYFYIHLDAPRTEFFLN